MDREQAKHICMELTADGARVTNLSLSGNRLVLTIEAQLSDSQLKASDQAARQAAAGSGQPRPGESQVRSDTEFLDRERAANRAAGGSEALPPAGPGQKPSVAFQPGQSYPIGSDTIRRENVGDAVSVNLADFQKGMDDTDEIHHGGFNPNDVMASHADTQPIVFEHNVTHHGAPAAPPLEPVRELTDTWDVTHDATTTDGVFQQHAETIRQQQAAAAHAAAPAPVKAPEPPAPTAQAPTPPTAHPAPAPVAPATPPPAPAPMVPPPPAISLDADPFPAQPSVTPLEAAPGFPEQPQPGPASAPRFGGDITLGDAPLPAAGGAGPRPPPVTAAVAVTPLRA
ncbi:MAG: hypothetical protein LIQ30_13385, partial [Planctomycetes bacterium]|nr:hypothetical protein [Planctomycetota bacterium]